MTPGIADRSDRDLVLAFQAGDRSAYDELYRRHQERVARVCYRFLRNPTDAEEATQETFLKAFQALPRFNGQFQVGAWLSRIATNLCVDQLRVKSRSHLVALPTELSVDTERGPEELLVGEHPEIDVAINQIQPLHADALRMRVDGMSHVEMAGQLRMTPPQVKALLHRARNSFKKAWDKAQGWLLLPVFGSRSLNRSSSVSPTSSNLAIFSAQAPALAEKAAASVLIVMVALTGLPSAPEGSADVAASVGRRDSAVRSARLEAPKKATSSAGVERASGATAPPAEAAPETTTLALSDTITSTVEGAGTIDNKEEPTDPTSDDEETVPLTAKETHKKAKEIIVDVIETIDD